MWVTCEDGVFDVSEFVRADAHPGGRDLLLNVIGGPIDAFWALYRVHGKHTALLESMRVAVLRKEDRLLYDEIENSFNDEPHRSPLLKVLQRYPFDAESPTDRLSESFFTPVNLCYIRNHFPVPRITPEEYEEYAIDIDVPPELRAPGAGKGDKEVSMSLKAVQGKPQKSVIATIMCTGNRSKEVTLEEYEANGAQIMNSRWSGTPLRDVLQSAGLHRELTHEQIAGWHLIMTGEDGFNVSIPLELAIRYDREVLLATGMNGKPLTRDHGYPVRVLVPGVVGVRSVKWLRSLEIRKEECTSPWQRRLYRIWPDMEGRETDFVASRLPPACLEVPVNSAIMSPKQGEVIHEIDDRDDTFRATGWAFAGGGASIIRVEVSPDGGKTWIQARASKKEEVHAHAWKQTWAWTLWDAKIPVVHGKEEYELQVRAMDDMYNVQPANPPQAGTYNWNRSGYLTNSYFRVKVKVSAEAT